MPRNAGDHQHLAQAAVRCAATSMRASLTSTGMRAISRPVGGQPALLVDRAEFGQRLPAIGDRARIGRFEEREILDPSQAERQHAQDHAGQRGATDFRIGVRRARRKSASEYRRKQMPGRDASAAALALVGAGLRDRLDVQAIELLPRAVALDARAARIDDVMDARHRQRGFGDVGREHDAALAARAGTRGPGRAPTAARTAAALRCARYLRRSSAWCASRISRSPGRNTSMSPQRMRSRAISSQRARAIAGRSTRCARPSSVALAFQRAVAHLDRIAAPFDVDHRRVVEMLGEARGVDRRRGDDDLQVAAARAAAA